MFKLNYTFSRSILLFCFIGHFFLHSQNESNLNDSILLYKFTNPSKALEFGYQALRGSEGQSPSMNLMDTYYLCGEILMILEDYGPSFEYLNLALEVFKLLDKDQRPHPYKDLDNPPWVLYNLGSALLKNGHHIDAERIFYTTIESFNQIPDDEEEKIYGLSTTEIALAHIQIINKNYEKALAFLNDVRKRRINHGKREDILHSELEFLRFYLSKDDLNKAKEQFNLLKNYYNESTEDMETENRYPFDIYLGEAYIEFGKYFKTNNEPNLAISFYEQAIIVLQNINEHKIEAQIELAETELKLNRLQEAEMLAIEVLKEKVQKTRYRLRLFKILQEVYYKTNKVELQIAYKDSLISALEIDRGGVVAEKFNDLENKILLDNLLKENYAQRTRYTKIISGSIVLILLAFFSAISLRAQIRLHKERNKRLKLEADNLNLEISSKNREIAAKSSFISERSENLKRLKSIIEKHSDKEVISTINSLIQSENTYNEFERAFVNVYPNFYSALGRISRLSKTDLKLASLIKMNYSNYEIARLCNVSMRTVESQRYRLSKKLNLEDGHDLNFFIQGL